MDAHTHTHACIHAHTHIYAFVSVIAMYDVIRTHTLFIEQHMCSYIFKPVVAFLHLNCFSCFRQKVIILKKNFCFTS